MCKDCSADAQTSIRSSRRMVADIHCFSMIACAEVRMCGGAVKGCVRVGTDFYSWSSLMEPYIWPVCRIIKAANRGIDLGSRSPLICMLTSSLIATRPTHLAPSRRCSLEHYARCCVCKFLFFCLADMLQISSCRVDDVYFSMQDGHFRFVNGDNIGSRCTFLRCTFFCALAWPVLSEPSALLCCDMGSLWIDKVYGVQTKSSA